MTPSHTNKRKHDKLRRYYYYRCTKTFKETWSSCGTRHVSAARLENYVLQNLERISQDRPYIDSLIAQPRQFESSTDGHTGLGISEACSEKAKMSPKQFELSLKKFLQTLPKQKGIKKNIWVKKFIKGISYSKTEIAITLYYKKHSARQATAFMASGRPHSAAGRNPVFESDKKILPTPGGRKDPGHWLPG